MGDKQARPKLVWRNSLTDEPLEDELDLPERPQERDSDPFEDMDGYLGDQPY